MKIKNGSVFGTDHQMHECDLCFENGIITETSASGEYDARGCFVLPGFIDTHIHGAYGVKFYMQDGNLTPALDWLSHHGVTSILVTLCTEKLEEYLDDIKRIKEVADDRILGIHAEGPFVNPVRKGGMMWDRIQQPDCEIPRTINEVSGGMLRILSLAPELEGAEEVIQYCKQHGVHVSMAHSDATFVQAVQAVDWGVTRATHLFNAMRPFGHREPGVIGCALTDERINCELICDMHHVSAPAIKLAVRAKGIDNITMISDCDFFCGISEGEYEFDGRMYYVSDGFAKLEDGTICGSAICLADGAKKMYDLGFGPEEIAVMACVNPAKACGCGDRGELAIGRRADIIILDSDFRVKDVFVAGVSTRRNPEDL